MSRTYHHTADRYTGWTSEGAPRTYVKRLTRRAIRHAARSTILREILQWLT